MKYRLDNSKIFISLEKGDNINQTFESFAEVKGIGSAWLNGIGAIKNPEIGYYSLKDKVFQKKVFKGEYELTSLVGNISLKDGKPFSHTHITFSDSEYKVLGGHLFNANISAAGEFILQLGTENIDREMNNSIGLPLWCLNN